MLIFPISYLRILLLYIPILFNFKITIPLALNLMTKPCISRINDIDELFNQAYTNMTIRVVMLKIHGNTFAPQS